MAPDAQKTAAAAPAEAKLAPRAAAELVLPPSVISRADLSRAYRELGVIDDYFHQAAVRGGKVKDLPAVSKVLDGLTTANNLNLLHGDDRGRLKDFLARLKVKAPVVHISFPSEASEPFLAKILEWFRKEAHPYTVLHVGLQPELAAGCLIRTTNKLFDFSFRKRFEKSKEKLMAALEALDDETVVEEPAPEAVIATTDSGPDGTVVVETPLPPAASPEPSKEGSQ